MRPLCIPLLLLLALHTYGQDNAWKKSVGRFVNLEDFGKSKRDKANHTALARIMADAVRDGEIMAYDPLAIPDEEQLTGQKLADIFHHREVYETTDPIDGHKVHKVIEMKFRPEYSYQYKVIEDWVYDPYAGKAAITIRHIAFAADVYGDDGKFRGKTTILWVRYPDLVNLMKRHHKEKLLDILTQCILDSHFEPYAVATAYKKHPSWERDVISSLDMKPTDTLATYLRSGDWKKDSTLADMVWTRVANNQVPAWAADDISFRKQLSKSDITRRIGIQPDTQVVTDPVSGIEVIKIITHDPLIYVSDFGVLEHWIFEPASGKLTVSTIGIGPEIEQFRRYDNDKPRNVYGFWMRYGDVKPALKAFEQYNPTTPFSGQVWRSFFESGQKPEVVTSNSRQ